MERGRLLCRSMSECRRFKLREHSPGSVRQLEEALELYFEDNDHPEVTVIEKPEIVDSILKYA